MLLSFQINAQTQKPIKTYSGPFEDKGSFTDGQITYTYYENDDLERVWHGQMQFVKKITYPNSLTLKYNCTFVDGLKSGPFTLSLITQNVQANATLQGNFKNGILDGSLVGTSANTKETIVFSNGLVKSYEFIEGGNVKFKGVFDSKGYYTGTWERSDGKIKNYTYYKSGVIYKWIAKNEQTGDVVDKRDWSYLIPRIECALDTVSKDKPWIFSKKNGTSGNDIYSSLNPMINLVFNFPQIPISLLGRGVLDDKTSKTYFQYSVDVSKIKDASILEGNKIPAYFVQSARWIVINPNNSTEQTKKTNEMFYNKLDNRTWSRAPYESWNDGYSDRKSEEIEFTSENTKVKLTNFSGQRSDTDVFIIGDSLLANESLFLKIEEVIFCTDTANCSIKAHSKYDKENKTYLYKNASYNGAYKLPGKTMTTVYSTLLKCPICMYHQQMGSQPNQVTGFVLNAGEITGKNTFINGASFLCYAQLSKNENDALISKFNKEFEEEKKVIAKHEEEKRIEEDKKKAEMKAQNDKLRAEENQIRQLEINISDYFAKLHRHFVNSLSANVDSKVWINKYKPLFSSMLEKAKTQTNFETKIQEMNIIVSACENLLDISQKLTFPAIQTKILLTSDPHKLLCILKPSGYDCEKKK